MTLSLRDEEEEIRLSCARCGGEATFMRCDVCAGDCFDGHDCGEDTCCCLYPEDDVPCIACEGRGGWYLCGNPTEWCEANPLPGREDIQRGALEGEDIPL